MFRILGNVFLIILLCPLWATAEESSTLSAEVCTQQLATLQKQFDAKSSELMAVRKDLDLTTRSLYQTILPRSALDIKLLFMKDDQINDALTIIQQLRDELAKKQPPATPPTPAKEP